MPRKLSTSSSLVGRADANQGGKEKSLRAVCFQAAAGSNLAKVAVSQIR